MARSRSATTTTTSAQALNGVEHLDAWPVEHLPVEHLRAHPQNYKVHPAAQLEHIKSSIRKHGLYRNVIIARDNTILAGHGVVQAARELQLRFIPCKRLDLDPLSPAALAVLAGDNEVDRLAAIDDSQLVDILRRIHADDPDAGLQGTGFDSLTLAALEQHLVDAGALDVTAPEAFQEYDEHIQVEHKCPKCGYEWSGKPA